jgi:hypothetical protein
MGSEVISSSEDEEKEDRLVCVGRTATADA